jgi:AraC family transcriptional regulator of adaptative response/methylated-DNA-[protein]-cysteine methyltransferase
MLRSADCLHMKLPELLPPSDMMYRALVNRDSSFEGIFFVGVRTTGIFCRPTCTAKKPARQNVDFFATPSEALHGGYRPCLRCNPMDPDKRPPKLIERLRAEVERAPGGRLTDKELAALSIQAALRNDVSSLSSCAPHGSRFARSAQGWACG